MIRQRVSIRKEGERQRRDESEAGEEEHLKIGATPRRPVATTAPRRSDRLARGRTNVLLCRSFMNPRGSGITAKELTRLRVRPTRRVCIRRLRSITGCAEALPIGPLEAVVVPRDPDRPEPSMSLSPSGHLPPAVRAANWRSLTATCHSPSGTAGWLSGYFGRHMGRAPSNRASFLSSTRRFPPSASMANTGLHSPSVKSKPVSKRRRSNGTAFLISSWSSKN